MTHYFISFHSLIHVKNFHYKIAILTLFSDVGDQFGTDSQGCSFLY